MSFEYEHLLSPDYDWSKLHTKQILKLRDQVIKAQTSPFDAGNCDMLHDAADVHAHKYLQVRGIIRGVLSTREHVPNKVEAKAARQLKARQQRNR